MAINQKGTFNNNIKPALRSIKSPKRKNTKSNHLNSKDNQYKFAFNNSSFNQNGSTPLQHIPSSSYQNGQSISHLSDSLVFKDTLSTQDYTFPKTSPLSHFIQKASEPEQEHDQEEYDSDEEITPIIFQRKSRNIKKKYQKIQLHLIKTKFYIRNKYYTRLIITDYWLPFTERPQYNSIIIFDWDDTLFPTTYLKNRTELHQDHRTNDVLYRKIRKLELSVRTLLASAINKGNTFIITNAELDWVKFTSAKFYPLLMPLMNQIKIISAREENQMKYPGNDRMWKIISFMNIVKNYNCNKVTNIVCIGDSPIEMEAAKKLSSHFSQVCMKGIKFIAFPRIQEVLMQVKTVIRQFDYIYSAVKTWTIRVEKKN